MYLVDFLNVGNSLGNSSLGCLVIFGDQFNVFQPCFFQWGVFNCVLRLKDLFEILKQRSPIYGIWWDLYIPAAGSCSSIVYISWTIIHLIQIMVPTMHPRSSRARPWKRDGWKNDPFHSRKTQVIFCVRCPLYSLGDRWACASRSVKQRFGDFPNNIDGLSPPLTEVPQNSCGQRRGHCRHDPLGGTSGGTSGTRDSLLMDKVVYAENGTFFLTLPAGAAVILSDGSVPSPGSCASDFEGLCLLHAGVFRIYLTLWP